MCGLEYQVRSGNQSHVQRPSLEEMKSHSASFLTSPIAHEPSVLSSEFSSDFSDDENDGILIRLKYKMYLTTDDP